MIVHYSIMLSELMPGKGRLDNDIRDQFYYYLF